VKKLALSLVLLLALPAFATITDVQNNSNFACTSSPCTVTLNTRPHTTTGNLIAVWTVWQSSATYTVNNVLDSNSLNSFVSAVGPTVQSASSPPLTAQIFYAKSIQASSGHDVVTVTFAGSGSISAGVVAVEYSGLDQNYPLDSVSAGYSYSTGALLDSGTAAPANANLLVFGGGASDGGSASAGGGFTSIQAHAIGSGSGITEQMIVTGNNTLQRATAGLTGVGSPGNWVMQMAVFRDASWTVGGGWTPARSGQVVDASQFPGTDIGAKINNAVAALPLNPASKPFGTIGIDFGSYSFSTPIVINSPYVTLDCHNSRLTLTASSATAITLSDPPTTYAGKGGIRNCHVFGNGSASQIGIMLNEVTWSKLESLEVSDFNGTGSIAILFSNTQQFTENNGGTATAGILAMPAAANGWSCAVDDLTAAAANVAYNTRQTASSTTTVTVQNQTTSTGTPIAWGANDILRMSCLPY
jgi:hypothetical protein